MYASISRFGRDWDEKLCGHELSVVEYMLNLTTDIDCGLYMRYITCSKQL